MILEFSPLFQALAGLNLAYAGSKVFRNALDNKILNLKDAITTTHKNKILTLKSEIEVMLVGEFEENMGDRCKALEKYYLTQTKKIERIERQESNFPDGIKSNFLLVTLYCFSLLVISGYEQFYSTSSINVLLTFTNFALFTIVFSFIRNMIPQYSTKNIPPLITVSNFFLLIFAYVLFFKYTKNTNTCNLIPDIRFTMFTAIFIGFSAFLFHFLRVFIHRIYFRFQLFRVYSKAKIQLENIENGISIIRHNGKKKPTKFDKGWNWMKDLIKAIRKDKSH